MTIAESVVVRLATAAEIRPLRMAVLRPGQPVVPADYDADPATLHLAGLAGETVVGCASVFPSPYSDVVDAWQLRGMAVDPVVQGKGVGAQVLRAAIDAVRAAGSSLLWANARVSALGFYARLGFEIVGEEFAHGPLELPHKVIVLPL